MSQRALLQELVNSTLARLKESSDTAKRIRKQIEDAQSLLHREERQIDICQAELRMLLALRESYTAPPIKPLGSELSADLLAKKHNDAMEALMVQDDHEIDVLLEKASAPPAPEKEKKVKDKLSADEEAAYLDNTLSEWQVRALQYLEEAYGSGRRSEDLFLLLTGKDNFEIKNRKQVSKFLWAQMKQGRLHRVRRGWYAWARTGKWTEAATAWMSVRGKTMLARKPFSWQSLAKGMEYAGFPELSRSAVTSFLYRCVQKDMVELVRKGVYRATEKDDA